MKKEPGIKMTLEEYKNWFQEVTMAMNPIEVLEKMTDRESKDFGIWASHRITDIFKKEDLIRQIGSSFIELMKANKKEALAYGIGIKFLKLMHDYNEQQNYTSKFDI